MPAPYALQPMVDRWRKDWSFMSGLWRERGEHTDAELEQLARDILESMVSTDPPFPDIDDRAQSDRIRAWGETFRGLVADELRLRPLPRNAISLDRMCLDSKSERRPMDWGRAFAGGRR
ncbi:MAG: hypothetical protein KDH20_15800 [Rhodocyclaceae bacterium]|nr:hypothetical protein [Rhodocyclaceae bacterium]